MTPSLAASSEVAPAVQGGGERSLEDLIERVPEELLLAEDSHAEGVDELEHDFWTDPCHFLRRACQAADYGGDERRV
jgi:hypothetical protein